MNLSVEDDDDIDRINNDEQTNPVAVETSNANEEDIVRTDLNWIFVETEEFINIRDDGSTDAKKPLLRRMWLKGWLPRWMVKGVRKWRLREILKKKRMRTISSMSN